MRLSEIVRDEAFLIRDGSFDILAQCTVNTNNNILTFLENLKHLDCVNSNPSIGCLICSPEIVDLIDSKTIGVLCVKEPKLYFFETHNKIVEKSSSIIPKRKTTIGKNCNISPLSSIADNNVSIGNNTIIEEFVTIKNDVIIGDNCIIRSGCVIGNQGYEFKRNKNHSILSVEHAGKLILENNVEVKEFCSIHQAVFSWDYTKIGEYSKIDAHSHIGHATKIGKRVMIGSHCSLSGNICIEDDVYIGPGAVISNRLRLGEGCKISIGSVVTKDVAPKDIVTGNFAIDHNIFIKDLQSKVLGSG